MGFNNVQFGQTQQLNPYPSITGPQRPVHVAQPITQGTGSNGFKEMLAQRQTTFGADTGSQSPLQLAGNVAPLNPRVDGVNRPKGARDSLNLLG